ncbi:MAG: pentapeptide repeat-containing protein [Cyanobacteria bacterium J06626_26]
MGRANLTNADLRGVNLFRAQNVDLTGAICDRTTISPDGYPLDEFEDQPM